MDFVERIIGNVFRHVTNSIAEEKVSVTVRLRDGNTWNIRETQSSMNSGGFVGLLNSASFLEFALISTIHNARCPVDQNN